MRHSPHINTPETLPRILSARKDLVKGQVKRFIAKTRASSVLEISFGLFEASFVCQPKSQELTTRVCSLKRLVRGKSETFVSLYHEIPTTGGLLDAIRPFELG